MSDFDIRGSLKLKTSDFTRGVVQAKSELASLERQSAEFHRRELDRERQRRSFLAGLAPGGRRATGVAGLVGAITGGTIAGAPVAGAGLSVLSGAPALTAGLAPLLGTLPAIGTAAVGAGQGMLVLKDATDGLMKVINADTPKKLATALKGLDKPTQAAAYTFRKELHPALERLHELSMKTVLPGLFKLGYAFEQLTKPGQALFDGFKAAGHGLTEVINSMTNLFEDKGFKSRLDELFKTTGEGIGKLGHILPPLMDAFVRVSQLAAPLLGKMADSFAKFAQTADHWIAGHGKEISQFFDTTFTNLSKWLHAIGDVGKIFFGLSTAAGQLSGALGKGITDFLDKIAAFVNSKDGQTKLKAFFATALPTLQSFGGLVKDLLTDLGKIGADPRTQKFLQGLFDFLRTALLPLLNQVASAMPGVAAGLLPAMDTIGEFMKVSLAPLIDSLLKLVEVALPPLIPLIKSVAELLKTPLEELTKTVDLLSKVLGLLGSVGGPTGGALDVAALFGIYKLFASKGDEMIKFLSGGLIHPGGKGVVAAGGGTQMVIAAPNTMARVKADAGLIDSVAIAALGSKEAKEGIGKIVNDVVKPAARYERGTGRYRDPVTGRFSASTIQVTPGGRPGISEIDPGTGTVRRLSGQQSAGAAEYAAFLAGQGKVPKIEKLGNLTAKGIKGMGAVGRGLATFEGVMAAFSALDDLSSGKSVGTALKTAGKSLFEPFGKGPVGGAAAGALYGSAVMPGWGTLIGAILGTTGGTLLSGGGDPFKGVAKSAFGKGSKELAGLDVRAFKNAPLGGQSFINAVGKFGGSDDEKKAAAQLQAMKDKLTSLVGPETLAMMGKFGGKVNSSIVGPFLAVRNQAGSAIDNLKTVLHSDLDTISQDFGSIQGKGLGRAKLAFQAFSHEMVTAIEDGRVSVSRGIDGIGKEIENLGPKSRAGRALFASLRREIIKDMGDGALSTSRNVGNILTALNKLHPGAKAAAQNFKTLSTGIQDAMASGVQSVQRGTQAMVTLTDAYLKSLGATPFVFKQVHKSQAAIASALGPGSDPRLNPITSTIQQAVGGQRGFMTVGSEKAVGGDNVPALFNGKPAVVADGENIAVFNRHQRAELNERLADVGGLRGFFTSFRKPHTAAFSRGGLDSNDGFFPASGTNYSVGVEPQIAARLGRLAHALHLHLIGLSGYRSPSHSVNVGGFANDPHTRGMASDTPGIEGVSEAMLERFGLTRPFGGAHEADHIQLLGGGKGVSVGGAGAAAAAAIKKLHLAQSKSGMTGYVGAVADKLLVKLHDAMIRKAEDRAGGSGGFSGGGTSGANQALGRRMMLAMGWGLDQWGPLKALWTRESGWNQNARNPSSGAYGIPQALGHGNVFGNNPADQIRWGLNYIKGRYGSPAGAWAHEQQVGWYSTGGMTSRSMSPRDQNTDGNTSDPGYPGYHPKGPPSSAKNGGKKKKKSSGGSHSKKPVSAGPDVPRFGHLRPGHGGGSRIPGIRKSLIALQKVIDGDTPIEIVDPGYDLTLSLYNGLAEDGGFPDATNYLTAHPEYLRQYKGRPDGVQAFLADYGDQIDVLNTTRPDNFQLGTGLNFQGVFSPGIPEEVHELLTQRGAILEKLRGTSGKPAHWSWGHAGRGDWAWGGNLAKPGKTGYVADLAYLHRSWLHYKKLKDVDSAALKKYRAGHMTWQDKVDVGEQKVSLIENWLSDYRDDAVSHRMSAHAKREKIQMEKTLRDTRAEIAKAKKDKPPATGNAPRKAKTESTQAYQARLSHWRDQQRGDKTHAGKLQSNIAGWSANLDFIDGDQFAWNTKRGMAGQYMESITSMRSGVKEIDGLLKKIYGTRILPVDAGASSGSTSADTSASDQVNDDLRRSLALAGEQFKVFAGFAPMVGARMIGAFAHGGVVPETGMALVHKNETIIPDPEGPFSNRVAAALGRGGDTHLEVHLHGGLDAAVERAVMKHGPKIIRMTSEQQGRRTRLIASAPGGR